MVLLSHWPGPQQLSDISSTNSRTFRRGLHGERVVVLQGLLAAVGHRTGLAPRGALRKSQQKALSVQHYNQGYYGP